MSTLAVDGGTPVRTKPFPTINDSSGRAIGEQELALLKEVIDSGRLNRTSGTQAVTFEREFAEFFGVQCAQASTSGTAAIHLAVGALNPNPGDEIITAPITDMGTVIPILAQNCIPVFADIEPRTFNISAETIEPLVTDRTVALIPVHLAGNPCEIGPIMALAEKRGIKVIEDCSQAYLTRWQGRVVGTIGHMGTFSMQQSKHLTTGDGGMTITNDETLGRRATLFADKGWPRYSSEGAREYLSFGFNYRMTELQAAVGRAQLKKVTWVAETRHERGDRLTELISGIDGVIPPFVGDGNYHTYWWYHILIDEESLGLSPAEFARRLSAEGIPAGLSYIGRPIFLYELLRRKQIYGNSGCPFDCPHATSQVRYEEGVCPETERALARMVCLPINEFFTEQDVEDMATAVHKVAGHP